MTHDPDATESVALAELARWVDGEVRLPPSVAPDTWSDPLVTDLVHDASKVSPGALFVCMVGSRVDGHTLAAEAVERGAVALLVDRPLDVPVAQIVVPDTRSAVGPVAARFFGPAAAGLRVVGITGTNGKTTVAHIFASIGAAAGRRTGVIGTLTSSHGTTPTTPEAIDLHRRLAQLRSSGDELVAIEVSSHSLALHRVDGLEVDVAVFTNLSRDHLDFHGTMDAYFQAKAMLFTPERARQAVVNLDDPHGRLLSDAAQIPTRGYGLNDVSALHLAVDHCRFTWQGRPVRLPLVGRVNVSNALAAATAALAMGIEPEAVVAGLEAVLPVPGRFERVAIDAPYDVMVDYAHTPDALARALEAARDLSPAGRLHLVFGCGGDKDRTKRAPMGEIASRFADRLIITSDNPRNENPEAIIADIQRGVDPAPGMVVDVEVDRRQAIALALATATDGDLIVIAGKGHEAEQIIGDQVVAFHDPQVVIEEHARLRGVVGA